MPIPTLIDALCVWVRFNSIQRDVESLGCSRVDVSVGVGVGKDHIDNMCILYTTEKQRNCVRIQKAFLSLGK